VQLHTAAEVEIFVMYAANFLTNQLMKEFWKSVHICQSYYQPSSGLLVWDTVHTY